MKYLIFLIFIGIISFVSCKEITSEQESSFSSEIVIDDTEIFNYLPTSTSNDVYTNEAYSFSYKEAYEQAEWVAYTLNESDLSKVSFKRPYFIQDKSVKTKSADWRNFKNTNYNKGHLCPAADRKKMFEMYKKTFLTSNVSPQLYDFNAGIWNRLEQKSRYWAIRYKGVYIVSGGVLVKGLKTIGTEKVAVPNFFYKIILTKDKSNMIGFLMPHKESDKPLYNFVVSVDEIEKITGIDFFSTLPDDVENKLESNNGYNNWKF